MIFHWSLRDSKVSRTLLSIFAVLNNNVVWMVSIRYPTAMFSCPFNNPLVTVTKAPITNVIIVTFMFHSVSSLRYFSFFSLSFSFIQWSARAAKSTILHILFFSLIIVRPSLLADIWWSVCLLKSHWILCVPFSRTNAELCIYHLFVWLHLNFLYISQWIILLTQSCLALYWKCHWND